MADPTIVVDEGHRNVGSAKAANTTAAPEVPPVNEPSRASSSRVQDAMLIPSIAERSASLPPGDTAASPDDIMMIDDELVIPQTLTLQAERDALDDGADEKFFANTQKGFTKVISRYQRCKEELARHGERIDNLEEALTKKVEAAKERHADRLAKLIEHEKNLAEAQQALILKEAALDTDVENRRKQLADLEAKLIQQKVSQDTHGEELSIWEKTLESTLEAAEGRFRQ